MIVEDILNKGYLPKELPPCFFTEHLGANFINISQDLVKNESLSLTSFQNTVNSITGLTNAQKAEEKAKLKQIFKNRLYFSEAAQFDIPKSGLARNIVKILNPLHQGKLAESISLNYASIELLFNDSKFSTTKPNIETESGEGKRSVWHKNYGFFKETCIINSFKFAVQLKTDISKFYPSIYTHSIPWVTFGGKDNYKKNRGLSKTDPSRINNIYGDDIDERLMWCQNQQTMGIPIGPDTSFILAEIIACHIDKHLEKRLQKKKIDFLGYRYYDDYSLYFNSELDAQICLTELKSILNDFELKINDKKTEITKTQNELEKEWALTLKSFHFRPSDNDQREDIWNFFSLSFKYSTQYPEDSVLKLALNKFNFVRIENKNWSFFESLIFRLGLVETSALQKIAKLLITYKNLVDKNKLKLFCFEIINRHSEKRHDYELSWSLWLLNKFEIQPTKELFKIVFESHCACASIIALDLINRNKRIKIFNFSTLGKLITTENLNTKYWLLTYETVYKGWIPGLTSTIITDHFYFDLLKKYNVFFYDSLKSLDPLKAEHSYLKKIEVKLDQIAVYLQKNKIEDVQLNKQISVLYDNLRTDSISKIVDRSEIQKKLTKADIQINDLIAKIEQAKVQLKNFEKKKPYFVIGKRLEELSNLTSKEIDAESRQDRNLLFDPKYE